MKFNFKRSLCLCASALLMMSVAVPAVSANSNVNSNRPARTQRIVHHFKSHEANVVKANHLKQIHNNNLKKFNRIKRHLLNHQKNLQKIAQRLNRVQKYSRHHNARYVKMINRWNRDKVRLIHDVEYNQRGIVRLAEQVNDERHAIDLIKHPNTAKQINDDTQNSVSTDDPVNGSLYGSFSGSFYSNDNGKIAQASAKATDNNGKLNGTADLNGQPVVLNQQTINHLKSQFENKFSGFNQQMISFNQQLDNEVQNEINSLNNLD